MENWLNAGRGYVDRAQGSTDDGGQRTFTLSRSVILGIYTRDDEGGGSNKDVLEVGLAVIAKTSW